MSVSTNDMFYSRLPVNQIRLGDLLMEEHLFYKIPENWDVVITDVKKSTQAVADGLHETVNLVATGSIVAVLNIAAKAGITVPFFFGGDGATFIIPSSILEPAMKALLQHQQNTEQNFKIMLRVGHVPVEDIYAGGHFLNISKAKASDLFSIPVVLGDGLSYAERIIKGDDYKTGSYLMNEDDLDLTGMQCRWDKIKPPENYDEVVSLLVTVRNMAGQPVIFKKVIDKLDEIYGEHGKRKPITVSKLKLKTTLNKIGTEMKAKLGRRNTGYLLRNWFATILGSLYFKTKTGKKYLNQLVELSDTLVMDGRINTVISGTKQQREQLQAALDEMEQKGEIHYGLHVSSESVMSCYVRNMNEDHIHFVDGGGGGYTKAAGVLKKKLFAV
ncbi:MAG: DUF3095 domain-containing protein [Chitinophagaceae bacterium]|nr:DUF3095 domain-containing protein [Chitinophagaceae bacterium]